jgi:hypothetical protein
VKPTPTAIVVGGSQKKGVFVRPQLMLAEQQPLPIQSSAVSAVPHSVPMGGVSELSGVKLADWEKQGRSANVYVIDFNKDFSLRRQQQYTLWHANWEVYVGRFSGSQQDGIFLFDRSNGEGRLMDFNQQMRLNHYQEVHHLAGNWMVYSGDFMNAGRAQLLLYDPASGQARMLVLARDLSISRQKSYRNWQTNRVLYIGHFGMPSLSVMLYEPQVAKSTFIGFDSTLKAVRQYTVKTWDQNWQILIGSFLDRTRCAGKLSCARSDDILVLNRQTGQMEQYAFSFGRKFHIYDNRLQSFERVGLSKNQQLSSIDTTSFNFVSALSTSIRDEELY